MRKWLWLVFAFAPSIALACPVCGTAPEQSRAAYMAMTVVLSLLPLLALGSVVFWLYKKIKRAEAENELLRTSAPMPRRTVPAAADVPAPGAPRGADAISLSDVVGVPHPSTLASRDKVPQRRLDA